MSIRTYLCYTKYNQLIFLGGFNAGVEDGFIKNMRFSYKLESMNKKPTCIKNIDKPSCIDLVLTNYPRSLKIPCA